jgi:uncharacterized protein (DUF362 family)
MAVTNTNQGIEKDVKQAITMLGEVTRYIEPGERVLLKPNLFNTRPLETGCTTAMRVVLATARAPWDLPDPSGRRCCSSRATTEIH